MANLLSTLLKSPIGKRHQRRTMLATLGLLMPSVVTAQLSSADAQALLDRHNQVRAQVNSPALCMNQQLMRAAENHCQDMAQNNFFNHTGSNGSSPGDRIKAAGYTPWTWGENIAGGQANVSAVMGDWEHSSGHYSNIVNAAFREVGFARCGANLWVVDFAARGSNQTDCTAATTGGSGTAPSPTTVPQTTTDPGLAVYKACQTYNDGWHYLPSLSKYRIWWQNQCYQYNLSTKKMSILRKNGDGNWRFYLIQ